MDVKSGINDLIKVVSVSAPLLGRVLGGSYATVVLQLLSNVLGVNPNISEIIQKITGSNDSSSILRDFESEHCIALQKMDNESFKTEVDDRKDARTRQIKMHDWVPSFFALGYLLVYAVFQFYIIHYAPTPSNEIVSARFQDGMMIILAYYYGGIHKRKKKH